MKKKIGLFLCLALVISTVLPVVAIVFAGKPDRVPPVLEKKVFVHYKKGYGKPEGTPGKGPSPKPPKDEESGYYAFLSKGLKWKGTAVVVIDPDDSGLSETIVKNVIIVSAEEWDDGAYSSWGGISDNLFDGYEIVYDATFDTEIRDGRNEVLFGDDPRVGVIAVTVVWGYFSGPPGLREIVEFDVLFDTDYTWGDVDIDPTVMDLQNIATHEFGHGAGLADLYKEAAYQETMYGYSTQGETIKRSLYIGDIAGIHDLYGE